MPERFLYSLLLKMDPEKAHDIAKWGMKRGLFAPGEFRTDESEIELFGVKLPNPLGIAAGFDKYAQLQGAARKYGFGWIEEGSFTFGGGRGNRKKRLFRLEESGGLLNRMGLNCIPSPQAAAIFNEEKDQTTFAVSVAKTHDPEILGDRAMEDVVNSYVLLRSYGIYTAINISCPNTREGRTFEEPESFTELISALKEARKVRPVVIKFSPGLDRKKLEKLIEISDDFADGYEAVNTLSYKHPLYGKGGLSGPSLFAQAVETISTIREITKKPIVGVGGISTAEHAYAMKVAGANAFLCFTGFVYRHENNPYAGPDFAHRINEEYLDLLRTDRDLGSSRIKRLIKP